MKVFFDTEFTRLARDVALISIGLIDISGQHVFYAETTDNWQPHEYSAFCRDEVLPQLQAGAAAMPLALLRQKLVDWLRNYLSR